GDIAGWRLIEAGDDGITMTGIAFAVTFVSRLFDSSRISSMSMSFSGQVALVTGAAAGIGRATALAFAAQGLKVAVADLDERGGEACVAEIGAGGGGALVNRTE